MLDFEEFFSEIDACIDSTWKKIFSNSKLILEIENGEISALLYAIYMIETYHYTSHNARNQALVGVINAKNPVYTKFCFEHASEEVGHEFMALHDVKSLGIPDIELNNVRPLPDTEILIAYLYWISATGNPLRRLGYSYWAESCYKYINPLIDKLKNKLSLKSSQLTFFVAHSDIDVHHFEEIKSVIKRTCKTQSDLDSIANVMETSLVLTGKMLDGVYSEYKNIMQGLPSQYGYLATFLKQTECLEN